jgi:hypothetical protein
VLGVFVPTEELEVKPSSKESQDIPEIGRAWKLAGGMVYG